MYTSNNIFQHFKTTLGLLYNHLVTLWRLFFCCKHSKTFDNELQIGLKHHQKPGAYHTTEAGSFPSIFQVIGRSDLSDNTSSQSVILKEPLHVSSHFLNHMCLSSSYTPYPQALLLVFNKHMSCKTTFKQIPTHAQKACWGQPVMLGKMC